ncbi:MAG: hypothetical protein NTW14_07240 [bacterium]|nr:hypothetical protein [bacterium]
MDKSVGNRNSTGFCVGCKLNKELTKEHVIPQAIGGKLQKLLLCKNCNSNLGQSADSILAENFRMFCVCLKIKSNHDKSISFKVQETNTNTAYSIFQDGAHRTKPLIEVNKRDHNGLIMPSVIARSDEELSRTLNGLEKKYGPFSPGIQFEKDQRILGEAEHEFSIGSRSFNRSVAKTAYTFLALNIRHELLFLEYLDPIREFIFADKGDNKVSLNYIHTGFMDNWHDEVLHIIYIHFDTEKRNIVGYVQYFGIFRFSVLLAERFNNMPSPLDLMYVYNPITRKEHTNIYPLCTDVNSIDDILSPKQTNELVIGTTINKMKKFIKTYVSGGKVEPVIQAFANGKEPPMNTLYYGDNLEILRKYIADESVDLIYLDPPFNSKRAYNVIFQDKTGQDSAAQIQAFEDTWTWTDETQSAFDDIMSGEYPAQLKHMMNSFREFMGINNLMAYLTMMAIRLVELHRVLKKTGSIYLHCDPFCSTLSPFMIMFGILNIYPIRQYT